MILKVLLIFYRFSKRGLYKIIFGIIIIIRDPFDFKGLLILSRFSIRALYKII